MQLKCSVLPNEAEKSSEQELLHFTHELYTKGVTLV